MAKKREAFLPMFCGDFFSATAEWEGEEEALYALLLMRQWSLGHLPTDIQKLARLVKYDPRTFERWWPTVASKFEVVEVEGKGSRLINRRLEEHREKSIHLSEKNAQAGKLGAEAKKRKSSERHPEKVANAAGDGSERHRSATAPIAKQSIPSHPIPSGVLTPSPQAPNVRTPSQGSGAGLARAESGDGNGSPEGSSPKRGQQTAAPWSDGQLMDAFAAIRSAYPARSGTDHNWLMAEHHWRIRITEHSPEFLLAAVVRYRAYVDGGGVSSSAHVLGADKFFSDTGRKAWSQPWNLPKPAVTPIRRMRTAHEIAEALDPDNTALSAL